MWANIKLTITINILTCNITRHITRWHFARQGDKPVINVFCFLITFSGSMESMQVLRGAVRNQFMLLIKFKDQVSLVLFCNQVILLIRFKDQVSLVLFCNQFMLLIRFKDQVSLVLFCNQFMLLIKLKDRVSLVLFWRWCETQHSSSDAGRNSSVVRAPHSWLKGCGFKSLQENVLHQGQLSVLTLILVSVPSLFYHSNA